MGRPSNETVVAVILGTPTEMKNRLRKLLDKDGKPMKARNSSDLDNAAMEKGFVTIGQDKDGDFVRITPLGIHASRPKKDAENYNAAPKKGAKPAEAKAGKSERAGSRIVRSIQSARKMVAEGKVPETKTTVAKAKGKAASRRVGAN